MNRNDFDWLHVLCQDMDRARALTVSILVDNHEWDQLVNLRCFPSDYLSNIEVGSFRNMGVEAFRFDYQITELLRKCSDLPLISEDPGQAAIETFYKAEKQCTETNWRLSTLSYQIDNPITWLRLDKRWEEVVKHIRIDLKKILGPLPDELIPKFSSGSTFADRKYLLPQDKMSARPTCTLKAYTVIEPFWAQTNWCHGLLEEYPNRSLPRFIRGNRFTTVPKDAKTHRGICVEPSLNVTYQLSVGTVIRKRLRSHGIDLRYGQSLHQRLVREASLTLDAGTIDISTASDTVAYQLVKLLLPEDWFDLLDSLRSPQTYIQGRWHTNQKFSSMGNGFTFELETLLFFAIARTVSKLIGQPKALIKVYGDDIIVSTTVAGSLVNALRFFGFITNQRKTYIDDIPFRESCGSDYYCGIPVRSHYVKSLPKEPTDWIKLANGIRRMAKYDHDAFGDLYRYKRSWLRIINHVPSHIQRLRCPDFLGDVAFHDEIWERNTRYRGGYKYIQVLEPTFDKESRTSYDRKFWTRRSILHIACSGGLKGSGDRHIEENGVIRVVPGFQKKSRHEPTGYRLKWIRFSDHGPAPIGTLSKQLDSYFRID